MVVITYSHIIIVKEVRGQGIPSKKRLLQSLLFSPVIWLRLIFSYHNVQCYEERLEGCFEPDFV